MYFFLSGFQTDKYPNLAHYWDWIRYSGSVSSFLWHLRFMLSTETRREFL